MSTLHLGVCEWAMSLLVGKSEEIGEKIRSKFGENYAQTSFQKRLIKFCRKYTNLGGRGKKAHCEDEQCKKRKLILICFRKS